MAARTRQAYLTAIKSFTKWLTVNGKLNPDPLTSITKPDPKADRKRERRMLLPEEWPWLKAATLASEDRYGIKPAERALLYETAIQTGLRSTELRSLTRGLLYVHSDNPYIICKAGSTKNRKQATQYLEVGLAAALNAHIATKTPKAPVFAMADRTEVATMLREDLVEARSA